MTQRDEHAEEDEYLTVKDVQRITKFGSATIYKALQSGDMESSKSPGLRGHYRIRPAWARAWVDRMKNRVPPDSEQKAS